MYSSKFLLPTTLRIRSKEIMASEVVSVADESVEDDELPAIRLTKASVSKNKSSSAKFGVIRIGKAIRLSI